MKILVVYYSMYGHVLKLARAAAEGAQTVAGAEVEALVAPYGFARQQTVNLGPYNYLITFVKEDGTP